MKISSATFVFTFAVNFVSGLRPNIIVMQPDDLPFFDDWTDPPNNPNNAGTNPFPAGSSDTLPYMEKLRTEGLQMMQAYASSPQCATSRFSTITGRLASRSQSGRGVARRNNAERVPATIPATDLVDSDCDSDNLAQAFSGHGYRTGVVGKWHLLGDDNVNYTDFVGVLNGCGFDYADGVYKQNLDVLQEFHNLEWSTEKAVRFIKNLDDEFEDKPFFLYLNPTAPHGGAGVMDSLQADCLETPGGTLTAEPMVKGMTIDEETGQNQTCREYRDSVIARGNGTSSDAELGAIWVDDMIKAVFIALEEVGELENTIIVYQMDHGMETKSALYENGGRIAQFIYYPELFGTDGLEFDGPVSTIDIGPTLFHLAGIHETNSYWYEMDGESWMHYLFATTPQKEAWVENRCLLFEDEHDRAVLCGRCEKLMTISNTSDSGTIDRGQGAGLATDALMYFDLCNAGGEYINDGINPEATNTATMNLDRVTAMENVLLCFDSSTDPHVDPDYETRCDLRTDFSFSPTFVASEVPSMAPSVCEDSNATFSVGSRTRDCEWAAEQDTVERCSRGQTEAHCPYTCGLCGSSSPSELASDVPSLTPTALLSEAPTVAASENPTVAASDSPSGAPSACVDSTGTFRVGTVTDRTCAWVAEDTLPPEDPDSRCNRGQSLANCPYTCKLCGSASPSESVVPSMAPTDCADYDGTFPVVGEGDQTCTWAGNRSRQRCIGDVPALCPLACGLCDVSDAPSSAPSDGDWWVARRDRKLRGSN